MSQIEEAMKKRTEANDQQIKALIFDFGGVIDICSNGIDAWTKAFRELGTKNEISMAIEPCKTLINDYATGKFASDQVFLEALREMLVIPPAVSEKAIIEAWNTQILGHNEELHKLVGYSKKFKLLALSNTTKMHRDFAEYVKYPEYVKKHPDKNLPQKFRDLFSKVYCSHEIFTRKPLLQAWLTILQDHPNLTPNQFVFIDDVKEYIDAAAILGIHTFHFDITKHSFDDVIKFVEELNNAPAKKTALTLNVPKFNRFASEQDLKNLLDILSVQKVPFRINAQPLQSSHTVEKDKKSHQDIAVSKSLLFENNILKVFLVQASRLSRYYIIEPKNKYREEDVIFMSSVNKFIDFLKQTGFMQYCLSQSQGDKSIKLIPIATFGRKVDINSKIINSLRCFFDETALKNFDELPSCEIYPEPQGNRRFNSLSYPRKSIWVNISELSHNVSSAVMEFMIENNIVSVDRVKAPMAAQSIAMSSQSVSSSSSSSNILGHLVGSNSPNFSVSEQKPETKWRIINPLIKQLERNVFTCVFCNPEIIRKQLVLDMGIFLIMLNYQPYPGTKAHFLIVPNHIEDWSNLTATQNSVLPKILKALTISIQANCHTPKKDILSYIVNGFSAGQTVSGSHLHVITRPQVLPYLIDVGYQMIGKRNPDLSKEQMTTIANKFKPEIFQSLLFDLPIDRLAIRSYPPMMLYAYPHQQALAKGLENKESRYESNELKLAK